MELREYKPEDSKIICGWIKDEKSLYQWSANRIGKFPLEGNELNENYKDAIVSGNLIPLTAVEGDKISGHLFIRFPDEKNRTEVRFGFVIVSPELRGKGNGKKMLNLAIEYAHSKLNAKRITLGVFENNPKARRCYESVGFKPFSRRTVNLLNEEWSCVDMEMNTNSCGNVQRLYHYTDFNAMRGIITNGEIWLWNLRRMNDSQEMMYFINELKIAVKKQLSAQYEDKVEELFAENLKDFDKLSSYASCFSEYADDASQWARYAKNGMGVCIAFNGELLSLIGEAAHTPLYKVNYSKNCDDLEIVKELAELITNRPAPEKIRATFSRLVSSSPLFKHPSFISEKEYRLVSLPGESGNYLGEPHFFVEETNIKKYYILKLKNECEKLGKNYPDLFEEICIGPQARVTKEVLADYFETTGTPSLCDKIKLSECPLRRF